MATEKLQIILDAAWRGKGAIKSAQRDIRGIDKEASRAKKALKGLGIAVGATGVALAGLGIAAKVAWDTLGEGAALNRASSKFDNLAKSIGSSADVMLSRMNDVTFGMVSNAELIAGANEIMQGKLAKTEESVIRLSAVSGALNWDMGVLAQTINNQSVLRLDNLGLAVEDVISPLQRITENNGRQGSLWACCN